MAYYAQPIITDFQQIAPHDTYAWVQDIYGQALKLERPPLYDTTILPVTVTTDGTTAVVMVTRGALWSALDVGSTVTLSGGVGGTPTVAVGSKILAVGTPTLTGQPVTLDHVPTAAARFVKMTVATSAVPAGSMYVDAVNGNDANTGADAAHAKRTFSAVAGVNGAVNNGAIAAVEAGTTNRYIVAASGHYREGWVPTPTYAQRFTSTAKTLGVLAAPGAQVWIDGSDILTGFASTAKGWAVAYVPAIAPATITNGGAKPPSTITAAIPATPATGLINIGIADITSSIYPSSASTAKPFWLQVDNEIFVITGITPGAGTTGTFAATRASRGTAAAGHAAGANAYWVLSPDYDRVFMDGLPLERVDFAAPGAPVSLGAGQYIVDHGGYNGTPGTLYLGDDPTGRTVEAVMRAFPNGQLGNGAARGIGRAGFIIDGIGFTKWGTDWVFDQNGALIMGGTGQYLRRTVIAYCSATGAAWSGSTNLTTHQVVIANTGSNCFSSYKDTLRRLNCMRLTGSNWFKGWDITPSWNSRNAGQKSAASRLGIDLDILTMKHWCNGYWTDVDVDNQITGRLTALDCLGYGASIEVSNNVSLVDFVAARNGSPLFQNRDGMRFSAASHCQIWNAMLGDNVGAAHGVYEDSRTKDFSAPVSGTAPTVLEALHPQDRADMHNLIDSNNVKVGTARGTGLGAGRSVLYGINGALASGAWGQQIGVLTTLQMLAVNPWATSITLAAPVTAVAVGATYTLSNGHTFVGNTACVATLAGPAAVSRYGQTFTLANGHTFVGSTFAGDTHIVITSLGTLVEADAGQSITGGGTGWTSVAISTLALRTLDVAAPATLVAGDTGQTITGTGVATTISAIAQQFTVKLSAPAVSTLVGGSYTLNGHAFTADALIGSPTLLVTTPGALAVTDTGTITGPAAITAGTTATVVRGLVAAGSGPNVYINTDPTHNKTATVSAPGSYFPGNATNGPNSGKTAALTLAQMQAQGGGFEAGSIEINDAGAALTKYFPRAAADDYRWTVSATDPTSLATIPSTATSTVGRVVPNFVADILGIAHGATARLGTYGAPIPVPLYAVPTIDTTTLPDATIGVNYSTALAASGGSGTFTWAATGLANGLAISSGGVITATPVTGAVATLTITATVTDTVSGLTAQHAFTLNVKAAPPVPAVATTGLPNAVVGTAYSVQLLASGGSGTFTSWAATGLANGLSLNTSTGVISGTPTATATLSLSVTVTDSGAQTSPAKALTLTIDAANQPPTVAWNNPATPADGSTVSGVVRLTVNASDDHAFPTNPVEVWHGPNVGSFVHTGQFFTQGPGTTWFYDFDTTTLANGTHCFRPRATDAAGLFANTFLRTFTVNNATADTTPPTVALVTPNAGTTVAGTITVTATIIDDRDVTVATTRIYVDGVDAGVLTYDPTDGTGHTYTGTFDTTTIADGSHTVGAYAKDAAGNATTGTPVTLTVANAGDVVPPTVTGFTLAVGQQLHGTVNLSVTVTDLSGVASVRLIATAPDGTEIDLGPMT